MDIIHQKQEKLKAYLREQESLAVAFSSGVDSSFLLKTAHDVLGGKVLAITARSSSFPKREMEEASAFTQKYGVRHLFCDSKELDLPGFAQNPPNRCYICKKELFAKMKELAAKQGFSVLAEGSNLDDNGDYRPGLQAVGELGVKSPLRLAELYKEEIRALSKELGLPTWEKPSFACLASRFPYGETISEEKLKMVEKAEEILLDMGFYQVRVRIHGYLARIEIDLRQIAKLLDEKNRQYLYGEFKKIGFQYISLDLLGYRTGSLNEALKL